MLNEEVLYGLNDNGFAYGNVEENFEIDESSMLLKTDSLKLSMILSKDADFISQFKLVIFKENENMTDAELHNNEQDALNGTYNDIVYMADIEFSNSGISTSGFCSDYSYEVLESGDSLFLNLYLEAIILDLSSNVQLGAGEHLSVLTYNHSGFDLS